MQEKLKLAVIGIGRQSKKYIELLPETEHFELVAVADKDPECTVPYQDRVKTYTNVAALLADQKPDVALVAVPHSDHEVVTSMLLDAGVHVIKEKPYAISTREAFNYEAMQNKTGARIFTTIKRRFDPVYKAFPEMLRDRIGQITHFEGHYTKNIARLDQGWRSSFAEAGGGALIDMGYHAVDLAIWYFGYPSRIKAAFGFNNRNGQKYNVEDMAQLQLSFPQPDGRNIIGGMTISRVSTLERESFVINGTNGTIVIDEGTARLINQEGETEHTVQSLSSNEINLAMLNAFGTAILNGEKPNSHIDHVRLIESAYQSCEESDAPMIKIIKSRMTVPNTELKMPVQGGSIKIEKHDFVWPVITSETEEAVIRQLYDNVSIYNRGGIFETFEDAFAEYHSKRFSLLSNSGTSAIHSMFEGLNLQPGDEVICPTYTFFATISPIVQTGAKPVFADCGTDGNIDPAEIRKKITDKTKAVIVTHMWGIPCEMDEIETICAEKGIPLLEDCSHAHGAKFGNRVCGSIGNASAWSLQGQKVLTGGEGGIMLTDDEEVFFRALAQGHYNKRCKQQIPKGHLLYDFAQTGLGLKFRAHPLAIAMAYQQFQHLDEWRQQRHKYATEILDVLSNFDFITSPNVSNRTPSWYALVFQVDATRSPLVNAEKVHQRLLEKGLREADMPGSTGPVHNLPLFTRTHEVMPRLYDKPCVEEAMEFPLAERFYRQAIKLPVWSMASDRETVDRYKDGLNETLKEIALKL